MNATQLFMLRQQLKLSRAGLAKILQVHPHTVYQWEKEKRQIPDTIETIFRLLRYVPSAFFNDYRTKAGGRRKRPVL